MKPLLYEKYNETSSTLARHYLALLFLNKRPKGWANEIEKYIIDKDKNSFYLYDLFALMRMEYRYSFASEGDIKQMKKLMKMIIAKHELGMKKPNSKVIKKVSDDFLPSRDVE